MATIPVLQQLTFELDRLYLAGAKLAKGDPRLNRLLEPLQVLGEKAAVFKTLASRLKTLINAQSEDCAAALMECGVLLYAVLNTQCDPVFVKEYFEITLGDQKYQQSALPYSLLSRVIEIFEKHSQKRETLLEEIYQDGTFADARLFSYYCLGLDCKKCYVTDFLNDFILPQVYLKMKAVLVEALLSALSKDNISWAAKLMPWLNKADHAYARTFALEKIQSGKKDALYIACIDVFGNDPADENLLLQISKSQKREVKIACQRALARMGSKQNLKNFSEILASGDLSLIEEALLETEDEQYLDLLQKRIQELLDTHDHPDQMLVFAWILMERKRSKRFDDLFVQLVRWLAPNTVSATHSAHNLLRIKDRYPDLERIELIYKATENHPGFLAQNIAAACCLYDGSDVYERYSPLLKKKLFGPKPDYKTVGYGLAEGYYERCGYYFRALADRDKKWDRRWASLFNDFDNSSTFFMLVYDADIAKGETILKQIVPFLIENKKTYYRHMEMIRHVVYAASLKVPCAEEGYKQLQEQLSIPTVLNQIMEEYTGLQNRKKEST